MSLHPQVEGILKQLADAGIPELSAFPPEQVRALTAAMAEARAGDKEAVAEARDIDAGGIPVRLYRPAGSSPGDVLPVLVWYHGGGWVIGSVDGSDLAMRALCNRIGAAIVSVEYRLAPEHVFPAAVDDCWSATRWVVSNATSLGVDATRLAVGGDSAGGNLAAAVALLAREHGGPAIRLQYLVYPAVDATMAMPSIDENAVGYLLTKNDMHWFYGHYGRGDVVDPTDWRLSPLHASSHAGLPPALVITAEFDPLRDEGVAYAAKLRAAGVPVELTRYDGMIHGFFGFVGIVDAAETAMQEAARVFRSTLG